MHRAGSYPWRAGCSSQEQEQAPPRWAPPAHLLADHPAGHPLGLTYGVVLTVARSLGEFGAVIMVSSGFPGVSQTLTLLVHGLYLDDHNTFGAYCAATLLMGWPSSRSR